ncbi:MAG TPA: family 16 glycoside hydrolase [Planctomycetaceae bacterium]|nr:family 16 glycoside hydrolase [Planctomycetaceae bacterium]
MLRALTLKTTPPGVPTTMNCAALPPAALIFVVALFAPPATLPAAEPETPNTLSRVETMSGWKLLFDGQTTEGWRNYRREALSDGWKVEGGALTRAGRGAGDIVTTAQYDSFELSIEYRISEGGNSGLMFHVTEDSPQPWHSGPEIQILDNARGGDPQKSGWLYQLYPASEDATRPAGEWNQLYVKVSPGQCLTYMNGVRYSVYNKGDRDWDRRVAQSKFAEFPQFGKATRGHICLQDHGNPVAFRNIKLRELPPDGQVPNPVDGTIDVAPAIAFPHLRWDGWEPVDERGRAVPLRPIVLTHAGDGSNRIFVGTQHGVVHVFPNRQDATESKVFLDLSSQVVYSDGHNEEGFLGMAFHPRHAETGEFFIYYTTRDAPHTSVVSRFRVSQDDADRADPEFEEELLRIEQPFWNHNGGTLAFGPDGRLYIALGDGGAANDPHENGQNLGTLLGSILRIDVDRKDSGKNYAIPPDNPFVGREGARGEIWAWGLRNVWRLSFDRETGRQWAADVGQGLWEEINLIEKGGNYGWALREGCHPFGPKAATAADRLIDPIWEYDHGVGSSITGGHVYRGSRLPELAGLYLYADYVTGRVWGLRYDESKRQVTGNYGIAENQQPIISFGEDEEGEVYFLIVAANGQGIFRFERKSP